MKRPSSLVLGLLLGLLFTLILNASSVRAWAENRLTVADLGVEIGSADEVYYFALIWDVRDGHLNLGNASLFEYRNAPAVAGFALLLQGLLARFTTLDLATVVLLGDLLFPLLICCLAFFILRKFLDSDVLSAMLSLTFMAWWSTGWLRSMHPQVTMIFFLLSLLAFVSDPNGRKIYVRAAALFFLIFVQPIFAAYILTIEALDALFHWKRSKNLREVILQRLPLAVYFLAAGILTIGLQRSADPSILAETYRRRGLILSHLPTAPLTQLLILVLLGFSVWIIRSRRATDSVSRFIPILLASGLVVLNQSVVHGRDAIFGLYYRYPLSFVLWLAVAWTVVRLLPRRVTTVLAVFVLAYTGFHMLREMIFITVPRNAAHSVEFRNSDLLSVMEEISKREKTEIVLAPIEVSNLVPVLTQHYSLFTQYAHFEYAPDQELAERYILLNTFFPLSDEHIMEGDPLVFGLFAGNLSARTRTWCRILVRTGLSSGPCDQKLEDFIFHQDIRSFVKTGTVDTLVMLRKYGVNTIITETPLPSAIARFCTSFHTSGTFSMYDCDFGR